MQSTHLKKLHLVCNSLLTHPHGRIKFPNAGGMEYLASLVAMREPRVRDVIGFLDGTTIAVQCAEDMVSQSVDYNGHTKETCCNNIFLFGPDGLIKWASINFPGHMHDSTVASQLIAKVINCIGTFKICVDQGFPRGGDLFERFVGPYSSKVLKKIAPRLRRLLVERSHIYTSLRQSSEWGMRALRASFARLKTKLTSDKEKRHLIILVIVLLHNFRTHHVGLNQIATVLNPHNDQYIHIDGYDKIRRYYAIAADDD
jgi:hypothetical protein